VARALYAGISSYGPEDTRKAAQILRALGTPCLIHQPKYSMFNRSIEDGLIEALEAEGMGCIVFSPLAQGLLTDRYLAGVPEGSRASKNGFLKVADITPDRLAKVKRLAALAQARGQTLAQMAIAWVLPPPDRHLGPHRRKSRRSNRRRGGSAWQSGLQPRGNCSLSTRFSSWVTSPSTGAGLARPCGSGWGNGATSRSLRQRCWPGRRHRTYSTRRRKLYTLQRSSPEHRRYCRRPYPG